MQGRKEGRKGMERERGKKENRIGSMLLEQFGKELSLLTDDIDLHIYRINLAINRCSMF